MICGTIAEPFVPFGAERPRASEMARRSDPARNRVVDAAPHIAQQIVGTTKTIAVEPWRCYPRAFGCGEE